MDASDFTRDIQPSTIAAVLEEALAVQQVSGPTFDERARADLVKNRFVQLRLRDVQRDDLDNVIARRPGGAGPGVLVCAHLDTVFDASTDLTIRREVDKIHGPGIGDNSLAVAALLALCPTLDALDVRLPGDLWLAANVGEEGLGDLRGMKAVIKRLEGKVDAAIVLEGMGFGSIVHQGIGVRRYRIEINAPGGHSWGDFGATSAIHRAVELGARLNRLQVPITPKTTFNIGVIKGGTSVNTIAPSAMMELDFRSESEGQLNALIAQFTGTLETFDPEGAEVRTQVIGNRPAGGIPRDHWLVQAAKRTLQGLGVEAMDFRAASTDANVPLSLGLPAVCIGLTKGGNAHCLDEYIETKPFSLGFQQLVALTDAASRELSSRQKEPLS